MKTSGIIAYGNKVVFMGSQRREYKVTPSSMERLTITVSKALVYEKMEHLRPSLTGYGHFGWTVEVKPSK